MKNKINFKIDTFEKAKNFYEALKLYKAYERMSFILDIYPELKKATHQHISELIGLERETVTRTIKKINTHGLLRY